MPEQIRALTSLSLYDGSFALAALAGRQIVFYDLTGIQRPDVDPIDVGSVNAMSRINSPVDGDLLATGGNNADVTVWDPHTRDPAVIRLPDDTGDLTAMTTMNLPDQRRFIAVGTVDGSVLRCDIADQRWVGPALDAGLQAVFALEPMALSDGRTLLVSAGEDRAIRVWDLDSDRLISTVAAAHDHAIRALVFIPASAGTDDRLASADDDGVIKIWHAGEHLELVTKTDHRHHRPVSTLAVMPAKDSDPPTLISAGKDEFVRRWTVGGEPIEPASLGHIGSVTALVATVTPGGERVLASAGQDAKVWIWNVDSGTARFSPPSIGRIHSLAAMTLQDKLMLAASGDDGRIRLHDPITRQATPETLKGGHNGSAFRVVWLPDRLSGVGLVSVGEDGKVLHWTDRGGEPTVLAAGFGVLYAVSDIELPGGRPGIAFAGRRGVFVMDPADPSKAPDRIFDKPTYALVSGELTDRSQGVAAAGSDGVIRLINPAETEPVHTWKDEHDGPVRCLAKVVRPGERNSLLSAGADGTVRIWDIHSGSHILARHDGTVLDLVVLDMPDGRQLLLSTGEDRHVQYLDLNAIDKPADIDAHMTVVSALCGVALSTGMRAAVGSIDGQTQLVDISAVYGDLRFRGASDRAVQHDRLHRKNLIAEVVDLLSRHYDSTDEGPTILSAEGAWGSGKSSVLEVVRRKLDKAAQEPFGPVDGRRLTAARADVMLGRPSPWTHLMTIGTDLNSPAPEPTTRRWVTAWFNPWAHQTSDQIWAGLTRAILDAAGKALYPSDPDVADSAIADDRWARFRTRRQKRRSSRRKNLGKEWYWLRRNRNHIQTRQLQWLLRRRALSPLLTVAVVALLIPLVARLLDPAIEYSLFGHRLQGSQVAMVLPGALLTIGVLHSVVRYYCGRASRWLPAELFAGPLPSGGQSSTGASLPEPIRDPLYNARAGYLYLVQHDVGAVLSDLRGRGVEVVVFVDDLDRCNPRTTAEVLEAINLFLSERLSGARFVLGLDPNIVAANLDAVNADLAARRSAISSEDPSFGWTFLRKLIQLPIVLPRLHDTTVDRLIADLLQPAMHEGALAATGGAATPQEATPQPDANAETADPVAVGVGTTSYPAGPANSAPAEVGSNEPLQVVMRVARDRHPLVRSLLAERIRDQPERSPRDIKRLLTVWQYYVRVLDRNGALVSDHVVIRARNLVIFAEIVTRWPALRARLQASTSPPPEGPSPTSGWRVLDELAIAADDDLRWKDAVTKTNLTSEADRTPLKNLRRLLRDYDGSAVAELARHIW